MLVVVVIIGTLLAIAYPTFGRQRLKAKLEVDARKLENFFVKAKALSKATRAPTRVVLDCAGKKYNACALALQTPVIEELKVKKWLSNRAQGVRLDSTNMIIKVEKNSHGDGARSYDKIFWVIFKPDGSVYSDPSPFAIRIKDLNSSDDRGLSQKVTVSIETGNITSQEEFF
jgi:type II secretory pathway pseudopilin PulG